VTVWCKLTDLFPEQDHRILSVRPYRRTYLHQADAGYDWAVGKEFVITTQSSPYCGSIVAVDEVRNLKRYGYTHLHIHYNRNSTPLEIEL
jgi:hypothetical protein